MRERRSARSRDIDDVGFGASCHLVPGVLDALVLGMRNARVRDLLNYGRSHELASCSSDALRRVLEGWEVVCSSIPALSD